MRKPSIQDVVYNKIYPKPRPNDPVSFLLHIQRCLVPEVREEVQRYFGRIDCLEAQYPGLDYTFAPHRRRLASFPWHRRLFRAFDELGLTHVEILALCTWEGTRAAKERYERDSRSKIECTTLSGVVQIPDGCGPRAIFHADDSQLYASRRFKIESSAEERRRVKVLDDQSGLEDIEQSVGVQLNRQLLAAASARERGELAAFDEQWEQWMKEALERNEMDLDTILDSIRQSRSFHAGAESQIQTTGTSTDDLTSHRRSMAAEVVPDFNAEDTPTLSTTSPVLGPATQTYEELHNILDELQTNNNRLAADNAAMANFLSRTRTETAR